MPSGLEFLVVTSPPNTGLDTDIAVQQFFVCL